MTAEFWVLFAAYLVKSVAYVVLFRSHQRLARACEDMTDLYDEQGAMYRAAYRDLIGDFTRLHTKYKEPQHDRRTS